MVYRISTPNERVWSITQLAKFSFDHSIGRTHSGRFPISYEMVIVHTAAVTRGGTFDFTLKIANTLIKNSSRDNRPLTSASNQPTANPLRVGQGQLM